MRSTVLTENCPLNTKDKSYPIVIDPSWRVTNTGQLVMIVSYCSKGEHYGYF